MRGRAGTCGDVAYGRTYGLPTVPRSGGHCVAGRSATTGILAGRPGGEYLAAVAAYAALPSGYEAARAAEAATRCLLPENGADHLRGGDRELRTARCPR